MQPGAGAMRSLADRGLRGPSGRVRRLWRARGRTSQGQVARSISRERLEGGSGTTGARSGRRRVALDAVPDDRVGGSRDGAGYRLGGSLRRGLQLPGWSWEGGVASDGPLSGLREVRFGRTRGLCCFSDAGAVGLDWADLVHGHLAGWHVGLALAVVSWRLGAWSQPGTDVSCYDQLFSYRASPFHGVKVVN